MGRGIITASRTACLRAEHEVASRGEKCARLFSVGSEIAKNRFRDPTQLHHRTTQGARRKNRKPLKRTHHPTQHGTSSLEGLLRLPSAKKRPWGGFWGLNTKKGQAFGENNYKSSRSCTPQSLLFCFE